MKPIRPPLLFLPALVLAAVSGCSEEQPPPCNTPACLRVPPPPGPRPTVFVGSADDAVALLGPVHRVPEAAIEGERIVFTEAWGDVIGFCADPLNEDLVPPALPKPVDVALPTDCDEQLRYDQLLGLCDGLLTMVVITADGSDGGDGSPASPLASLAAAGELCADGCCHWLVGPGDYAADTLTLPERVFIEGAVVVDPETAIATRLADRPSVSGDLSLRANSVMARIIVDGPGQALHARWAVAFGGDAAGDVRGRVGPW
jgi:hypothetical protein